MITKKASRELITAITYGAVACRHMASSIRDNLNEDGETPDGCTEADAEYWFNDAVVLEAALEEWRTDAGRHRTFDRRSEASVKNAGEHE